MADATPSSVPFAQTSGAACAGTDARFPPLDAAYTESPSFKAIFTSVIAPVAASIVIAEVIFPSRPPPPCCHSLPDQFSGTSTSMSRYGARVALTWQKAGLPLDASNHLVDVMVTSLIVLPAKLVTVSYTHLRAHETEI